MSDPIQPVPVPAAQEETAAKRPRVPPVGEFTPFSLGETEQSIPARFEQQVRRYPGRIAVKTRSHELTYAALDQAANRVAHALLARRGPGAEPIALLLEHDAPLIVALLGVLKAGKFYVPLDPSYPRARTAAMLEDSEAGLIVTENSLLPRARELAETGLQLLNLDALEPDLSSESLCLAIGPDAFAYLLYTSGSTGRPKGVVENHRNVLHFTMVNVNAYGFGPEDRLPLFVSCCFSGSASAIYGAVLTGASLHPLDVRQEGHEALADWLIREEITIFHGGSVFHHFVGDLGEERQFPRLRLIFYGGEPLSRRDVDLYKKHFSPDCVLLNMLGSSEMKCFRRYIIHKDTPITGSIVPVGYAVEDTEVLLLDEDGQPVADDAVGEIAVKTRYIAPAYWRRPDLTAAAFQPDPAGSDARIYRTGDLGRLLPDGCLLHLGRKDAQVKIRGHRVELGEIEAALQGLDAVREAAVVLREDRPGEQRLVAYLVPVSDPPLTATGLRSALAETLPDYMLPSAYVFQAALPRNANGKVDRQALPPPGRQRPHLETPFAAPRTPMEQTLGEIWAEVLGFDQVGVHDPFLELGGDSLQATQVLSRIRQAFSIPLPLRRLFQAPTVAELAMAIAGDLAGDLEEEQLARLLAEVEGWTAAEARTPGDERS
jgi:amino acid adenylation domain-containing protein